MKQVRFHAFGEPSDVLLLERLPESELPAGSARIRMLLRPVNPSDLYQIRGRYGRLPELPATAGLEGLGVVEAVADPKDQDWIGQRAVFTHIQGTWSETVVAPTHSLMAVPKEVSDQAAAQAMVNPLTAHLMIRDIAPPPGSWIVITAPASAVGQGILDLAMHHGFRVLAIVRQPHQRALPESRSATVVCTQDQDWIAQCRAALNGTAHAILDAVGGPQAADLFGLLRPGGTHLVYGALSLKPLQIPGGQIIYKHATVRGFMVFAWKQAHGVAALRQAMGDVFDHQAQGRLCPTVEACYPLENFREAVRHAEQPGRTGKILLGT